jgi:tetratricopeptide (TPR) repeat protein
MLRHSFKIAFLSLACLASPIVAADDVTIPSLPFKPIAKEQIVAGFMQALLKNTALSNEQRAAALKELTAEGGGDYAVTRALVAAYPDLSVALGKFADEETKSAIELLKKLATSADPYLAAHAEFYLARAYMVDEHYEEALPLLNKLSGPAKSDKTMHPGEALFYKAICHEKLLERTEALVAFATFLRQNPDASERLLIGAEMKVEELKQLADGSLWDVGERMDFSRRHLDLEKSGDPTQRQQGTIIAMLDKLIEEAEKKEKGGGGGGGGGAGQGQGSSNNRDGVPSSPATESTAPEGSSKLGDLNKINRGKAEDTWGDLRKKEKQAVIDAFKAKFPSRYRQAVEEYYKGLQEGKDE